MTDYCLCEHWNHCITQSLNIFKDWVIQSLNIFKLWIYLFYYALLCTYYILQWYVLIILCTDMYLFYFTMICTYYILHWYVLVIFCNDMYLLYFALICTCCILQCYVPILFCTIQRKHSFCTTVQTRILFYTLPCPATFYRIVQSSNLHYKSIWCSEGCIMH